MIACFEALCRPVGIFYSPELIVCPDLGYRRPNGVKASLSHGMNTCGNDCEANYSRKICESLFTYLADNSQG